MDKILYRTLRSHMWDYVKDNPSINDIGIMKECNSFYDKKKKTVSKFYSKELEKNGYNKKLEVYISKHMEILEEDMLYMKRIYKDTFEIVFGNGDNIYNIEHISKVYFNENDTDHLYLNQGNTIMFSSNIYQEDIKTDRLIAITHEIYSDIYNSISELDMKPTSVVTRFVDKCKASSPLTGYEMSATELQSYIKEQDVTICCRENIFSVKYILILVYDIDRKFKLYYRYKKDVSIDEFYYTPLGIKGVEEIEKEELVKIIG